MEKVSIVERVQELELIEERYHQLRKLVFSLESEFINPWDAQDEDHFPKSHSGKINAVRNVVNQCLPTIDEIGVVEGTLRKYTGSTCYGERITKIKAYASGDVTLYTKNGQYDYATNEDLTDYTRNNLDSILLLLDSSDIDVCK